MSRSTKSNIGEADERHIMSADQLARRFERSEAQLQVPGVGQIGRYRYAEAYGRLRQQTHREGMEICFLARGQQTYRVNGEVYRLRGGEQYIVFPGEPHDSAGFPEEKGVMCWVFVRLPTRKSILFLSRGASAALRRALLALPSRHFAAEPGTAELLEELIRVADRPVSSLDRLQIAAIVLRYLFATIRASGRNRRPAPSARIQRCLDHIAARSTELMTVPELAKFVRLSEGRFKVRFRTEVGLPPREYVLRHKIAAAQARLRQPDSAVTQVAHDLGFSSSQYFATVFRRFTGRTPSSWINGWSATSLLRQGFGG